MPTAWRGVRCTRYRIGLRGRDSCALRTQDRQARISRRTAETDFLRLRLGTLDTPVGKQPAAHIWVSGKADWDVISDDVPQYDGYDPGGRQSCCP